MLSEQKGILISLIGFALILASIGIEVLPDSRAVSVLGLSTGAFLVFGGYLWTLSHRNRTG